MKCPTCDGSGHLTAQYVLCEGHDSGIVAKSPNLEDLIAQWKQRAYSLRIETLDGQILPVSDEDYERATELSRGRRKAKA